ncbi:MAG: hypothetical protein KDA68_07345 [Planctomycetaceae bacterium]|nr:hypothetical protein [Planctomycetaceae bacterium]
MMDLREGFPTDSNSVVDFPLPHAKMIPSNRPRHALALPGGKMINDQQDKAEVIFTFSSAITFFVIQLAVVLLVLNVKDRVLIWMSSVLPTVIFAISQQGGELFARMPRDWVDKVSARDVQARIIAHGILFAIVSYAVLYASVNYISGAIHTVSFDVIVAVLVGSAPSCFVIVSMLYCVWMLIVSRWW